MVFSAGGIRASLFEPDADGFGTSVIFVSRSCLTTNFPLSFLYKMLLSLAVHVISHVDRFVCYYLTLQQKGALGWVGFNASHGLGPFRITLKQSGGIYVQT